MCVYVYIRSGIEFRFRWSIAYTLEHSNTVVRVSLEDLSLFTVIRFGYSPELFSCCEEGTGKKETGKEKGEDRPTEKLFDQVSVDGKLNQIGLDKATRIRGYMNHALLSFPLFFFFSRLLKVYLTLRFDDYFDIIFISTTRLRMSDKNSVRDKASSSIITRIS